MRVGSLVSQSGMLGVIMDNHWTLWLVNWTNGDYSWIDETDVTVEVICK
jgi:hypothetical protein